MHAKHIFKPTTFDHLESREVLSTMPFVAVHPAVVHHAIVGAPLQGSTMPNVSQDLNTAYNGFVSNGGVATQFPAQYPYLQFQGNSVGVTVKGKGNFNTLVTNLRASGMIVTASSAYYDVVIGFVPIASLPTISKLPETGSVSPNYRGLAGTLTSHHTLSQHMGGAMLPLRSGALHA
jgi:hypothetical protein